MGEFGNEVTSFLEISFDCASLDLFIDLGTKGEVFSDIGGDSFILIDYLDLELIVSVFVDQVIGNKKITTSNDENGDSFSGFFFFSFLEEFFDLGSAHFMSIVLI